MILRTVQMLTQEPWCLTPAAIADLTDWQIEHLYARPAIERARRVNTDGPPPTALAARPGAAAPDQPPERAAPEFRGWVVTQFMKMGMSRQQAERQFDEQSPQRPT